MMTPEQTAEAAADRSEQYRALLGNPALKEALTALRDEAFHIWRTTGPAETSAREDAWNSLRAVDRLEAHLEARAADGAIVAHNLKASLLANARRAAR